MSQSPLISTPRNSVAAGSRRSTRIEKSVPLIVLGQNRMGEPFMERTVSTCLNMHGCRYPSRHDYGVGTWVTLQVVELMKEKPATVRAMVRSVHPPASLRELPQIGVELETPGNVWGIAPPPGDWLSARERIRRRTNWQRRMFPLKNLRGRKKPSARSRSSESLR